MNRIKHFIPVIILLAFPGSCENEQFNTQHPEEGDLILTTEW